MPSAERQIQRGPALALMATTLRHHQAVELRTERLCLRPFQPEDVDAFERFAQTDEYRRYLGDHPDASTFVTNNLGVDGSWVIELDSRVIGSVFLAEEIACLLDPAVHGHGIASEAAEVVINDGFDRRGYDEIVAHADSNNIASLRAMAHLGFVTSEDGSYRLLRSTWQTRRGDA